MAASTCLFQARIPSEINDLARSIAKRRNLSMNAFIVGLIFDELRRVASPTSRNQEAPDAGVGPVAAGRARRV